MTPVLSLLRPRQWIKNLLVLAPLFFAGKFMDAQAWQLGLLAVLSFVAVSSVVYIINDLRDVAEDRLHPVKKLRPLATGKVTSLQAGLLASLMSAVALFVVLQLPPACAAMLVIYVLSNVFYTFLLKRHALLDVFFIASCYVMRVLMGCYALGVTVSPWIILSTFFLALFIAFGKRYHEVGIETYAASKPNLVNYNRALLDRLVNVSGCAALITYAIYTVEIAKHTGRVEIVYTTGFVAFGLFRYLQAIYVYNKGGEPEALLLTDRWQQVNLALWLTATLWLMF
jgi:decaprenyl-phosphate phosphoribosyltransferase